MSSTHPILPKMSVSVICFYICFMFFISFYFCSFFSAKKRVKICKKKKCNEKIFMISKQFSVYLVERRNENWERGKCAKREKHDNVNRGMIWMLREWEVVLKFEEAWKRKLRQLFHDQSVELWNSQEFPTQPTLIEAWRVLRIFVKEFTRWSSIWNSKVDLSMLKSSDVSAQTMNEDCNEAFFEFPN